MPVSEYEQKLEALMADIKNMIFEIGNLTDVVVVRDTHIKLQALRLTLKNANEDLDSARRIALSLLD